MSYLKIKYGDQEIELTPEAIKAILSDIREQIPKLNLKEIMDTVGALGIPLDKIIAIMREK